MRPLCLTGVRCVPLSREARRCKMLHLPLFRRRSYERCQMFVVKNRYGHTSNVLRVRHHRAGWVLARGSFHSSPPFCPPKSLHSFFTSVVEKQEIAWTCWKPPIIGRNAHIAAYGVWGISLVGVFSLLGFVFYMFLVAFFYDDY